MAIGTAELRERLFEFAVIGALYWGAYQHREVRKDFRSLGRRTKWITALVIGYFAFSALVQCFDFHQYDYPQRSEAFPFTRWAMFSGSRKSIPEASVYEFAGVTRSEEHTSELQ